MSASLLKLGHIVSLSLSLVLIPVTLILLTLAVLTPKSWISSIMN